MRRFNPNAGGEFPWYAHATAAVMGGSAVNMTFKKYGNPDISREELVATAFVQRLASRHYVVLQAWLARRL